MTDPSSAMAPNFTFPMIGILDPGTPHEPGETATRDFPDQRNLDVVWVQDIERRNGMLLVDAAGSAWKVVEARKGKRVFKWGAPYHKVDYVYVEQPAMPFEDLRNLLLKTLRSRKSAYAVIGARYMVYDRKQIVAARSLRDLVKTPDERAAANAPRAADKFEALLGEGRGGRREFMGAWAGLILLTFVVLKGWSAQVLPWFSIVALAAVIIVGGAVLCFRRLHDLGLSAWWWAAGWILSGTPTVILDGMLSDTEDGWLGSLWLTLGSLALLTLGLWPGQPHGNRFGPPVGARPRLDFVAASADDHSS